MIVILRCSLSDYFFITQFGWTPLMIAGMNGHLKIVMELLSFDADVNAQSKVILLLTFLIVVFGTCFLWSIQ